MTGLGGSAGARIIEFLRSRFPTATTVGDVSQLTKKSGARYIAVGPAALQSLLAREIEDPIFSLMVPRVEFRELVEASGRPKSSNVTAIYAEADPEAQIRLMQRLFKRETRVAVLHTQRTAYLQNALKQASIGSSIRLEFILVEEDGLNRALNQANSATAILAIPDDAIYNSQNIRTILLSTYQRGQPVIGFSTSLVKAGALGTTYSTVEDMVAQVAEQIQDYATFGKTPLPQYPKYFGVLINDSVSRSLDIVIDEQVRKLGRRPVDSK